MPEKIKTILSRWRSQPTIAENVVEWRILAQKPADLVDYPSRLSPEIADWLSSHGVPSLYAHQASAYAAIADGKNVAVVSGTASGKTYCYNLPVIDSLLKQPEGRCALSLPNQSARPGSARRTA